MRVLTARVALALAMLAIACGAAACGSDGSPGAQEPVSRLDLVVGNIVPLTGPDAGLGVSAQKAAQLAVEEVNDAIGEAEVEHTVEIIHQDETVRGPRGAAAALLDSGAGCILAPWSPRAVIEVAAQLGSPPEALLASPQVRVATAGPQPVVGLPGLGPQEALSSESRVQDRDDPSAEFARLYASTDPPIGPARTSDARQFDTVVLCYLAAVAAGSTEPERMAGTIVPRAAATAFSWLQLADAIDALERGERIVYAGITARIGIQPG
jgi:hypothetical protein